MMFPQLAKMMTLGMMKKRNKVIKVNLPGGDKHGKEKSHENKDKNN
jgi:hypothetical protein